MRGKIESKYVAGYVISQLVGTVIAALAVEYLKAGVQVVPMNLPVLPALLAEFLFTFALAFVVLNTAFAKGTAGNSFYGLAIGFTVTAGVYAVGGISGGVFNPAVAVGISIMGLSAWSSIWIYLLANFAGAAVAAVAFKAVNPSDN